MFILLFVTSRECFSNQVDPPDRRLIFHAYETMLSYLQQIPRYDLEYILSPISEIPYRAVVANLPVKYQKRGMHRKMTIDQRKSQPAINYVLANT